MRPRVAARPCADVRAAACALTIEPRSMISPPHTPHGSARSSAAARHCAADRAVGAQRLGPLQLGRGVGEPQVGIADMTRQLRQLLVRGLSSADMSVFTCFLVCVGCLLSVDPDQVCGLLTQKLWPRILVTSGPWPFGDIRGLYLGECPDSRTRGRGGGAVLARRNRSGGGDAPRQRLLERRGGSRHAGHAYADNALMIVIVAAPSSRLLAHVDAFRG